MIREFETGTELTWDEKNSHFVHIWDQKISIDIKWVASARSHCGSTEICMCGSDSARTINIPYDEFMVLWMSVKE